VCSSDLRQCGTKRIFLLPYDQIEGNGYYVDVQEIVRKIESIADESLHLDGMKYNIKELVLSGTGCDENEKTMVLLYLTIDLDELFKNVRKMVVIDLEQSICHRDKKGDEEKIDGLVYFISRYSPRKDSSKNCGLIRGEEISIGAEASVWKCVKMVHSGRYEGLGGESLAFKKLRGILELSEQYRKYENEFKEIVEGWKWIEEDEKKKVYVIKEKVWNFEGMSVFVETMKMLEDKEKMETANQILLPTAIKRLGEKIEEIYKSPLRGHMIEEVEKSREWLEENRNKERNHRVFEKMRYKMYGLLTYWEKKIEEEGTRKMTEEEEVRKRIEEEMKKIEENKEDDKEMTNEDGKSNGEEEENKEEEADEEERVL
jgi:hypothetical protein